MKSRLKALGLAGALMLVAGSAQAGCISFSSTGQYHVFINTCRYDVIAHYKSANSRHWSLSDRIPRNGGRYVSNATVRAGVDTSTCDYDAYQRNRCSFDDD